MPRPSKGIELWLEPAEYDRDGKIVRHAGGSSATNRAKSARAALEMTGKALTKPSPNTSPSDTKSLASVAVIPLRFSS